MLGAVAVTTLALLLFVVPLGFLLRQQVVGAELDALGERLEQTATFVDERSRSCGELQATLAGLASRDVDVVVFDRDGTARFAQPGVDRDRATPVDGVLQTAADGATGTALDDGDPVAAVPMSTLVCGERLVLQARTDGAPLGARVRRSLLLVGIAALVAVLAGALAASALGTRLARPLERLASSARRLGEGDFSERAPRSGLPEPDGIAVALDVTADRLGRAVRRGTAFAADASHQLRTPLTALRLQLETAAVGLDGDDPRGEAIAGALAEVDRLSTTIDELVELTGLDGVEELVDLAELVAERGAAWRRHAAERGRRVVVSVDGPVHARVRPAAVAQALDVLVDNALRHGEGDVTLVLCAAGDDGGSARIEVHDQGPGLPDDLDVLGDRHDRGAVPTHGGRGLLLARDLVEGEGGRVAPRPAADGGRVAIVVPTAARRGAPDGEQAP